MKQLSSCKLKADTARHPLLPHRIAINNNRAHTAHARMRGARRTCIGTMLQALRSKCTLLAASLIDGMHKNITEPSSRFATNHSFPSQQQKQPS
jgi:hypothetical protein